MAFFRVGFERNESIEIVVDCKDREELDRAIEGTLEEGFDGWATVESEWDYFVHPCGATFNPEVSKAFGELYGIDRSDPDNWQIVAHCDDEPAPPESEEERSLREFREAERAGQKTLFEEE